MICPKIPKLRPAAVSQFLKYLDFDGILGPINSLQLQHSFISEKFRKELKKIDGIAFGLWVSLENEENDDDYEFFEINWNKGKNDLDTLLNIIKFVEYPTIDIRFYNDNFQLEKFHKNLIKNFAYFCQKIKDIECVQNISADFKRLFVPKPILSIFIDLLPQSKKISIKSLYDVSSLVKKIKRPLELVKIYGLIINDCTSQIFRTNTKELDIESKYVKLHDLRKIGPFSPNPALQKLHITVDLIKMTFYSIKKDKWAEKILPSCQESLNYLKGINENLELFLETNEHVKFKNLENAVKIYERQLKRAKQIIDVSSEFGPKVKTFSINTTFSVGRVIKPFGICAIQAIMETFAYETQIKVETNEKDELINVLEYNGIQIRFKIKFGCFKQRFFDP